MLAIILIVNAPIVAYADSVPGTVTVEGGSIGSGGVEGNSNILKGTALTVVMATLASAGITVKLAAEDYAKGNTALNYLENKFDEWESNAQEGWANYEALDSVKVGTNGELYIPEIASNVMQKFLNWLFANDEINSIPQDIEMIGDAAYGTSFQFVNLYTNQLSTFKHRHNVGFGCVQIPNSKGYEIVGFSPTYGGFQVLHTDGSVISNLGTFDYRNKYGITFYYNQITDNNIRVISASAIPNIPIYTGSFSQLLDSISDFTPDVNTGIQNTGFYGETLDIPQLIDESGNGKILIVQPGLIGSIQDSYVGSNNATIGLQDYLDALRDLYGQQALPQDITDLPDITIPGEDAITGTREDVAVIDREIALNPDITLPADPDTITWPEVPEDAIAIADPSVPADPEVSIPAMSIDLTQYFPFCLPFDIYHILQKLNADPVTPQVTVDWGNILGSFGIDYVMNLDLHDYDNLAELLRNMETAAFVVGLAVVTRQMFLRG